MRSISGFLGGAAPSAPAGAVVWPPLRGRPSAARRCPSRFDEVSAEVADLLLRDLDLLEAGGDLLEGQVAAFASLGGEPAQLLDVHEARLGGFLQKSNSGLVLLRQPSLLQPTAGPVWGGLWTTVVRGRGENRKGWPLGAESKALQPTSAIVQRLVRFASLCT